MLWKTRFGRCLYRSEAGTRVFDNYFFRWLMLDSEALQTVINRFYPEKPGLEYINALVFMARAMPGSCCVLGLGGAGIAHALAPFPECKITAVELDEEVIKLAVRFFRTDKLPKLEMIHDEASRFMGNCAPQQFRHIMVDLFNANSFPETCFKAEFFADCSRALLPEGILAVNFANRHEQKPGFEMLSQQFSGATVVIPVKKSQNLIVVAINGHVNALLKMFESSQQTIRLSWQPKWGYVAQFIK